MENIAGYRTIYQGLIFTTIKGTGHMVPQWKRKEAFYSRNAGKHKTGECTAGAGIPPESGEQSLSL